MAVPNPHTMFKMPVIQMNCFGKNLARLMYSQEQTTATTRPNANRIMVLLSSEKELLPP